MQILFLITRGDSVGGAQIHLRDLAKRLQQEGHTVTVAFGKTGAFSELLESENIHYKVVEDLERPISLFQDMRALKNILSLIRELNPDLVALHSSKVGILGRIAAKIARKPVIFTAHGWSFTEGKSRRSRIVYAMIESIGALLSDKVITVSEYDRALALRYHLVNPKKMVCIHNGVPDMDPDAGAKFAMAQPVITMVARFQEPKEHQVLVEVLSQLTFLPWQLQLVGEDGGLMPEVQQLIAHLHLEDRIKILGNRSDVDQLLAQSDIFVLVSRWEGFPLTILEAMRAGLPVIASDVGGIPEAVQHEETGYLVQTPQELKTALSRLLESSGVRQKMGRAGRIRYEQYFTFEHMYQSTCRLYRETAGESD